MFKNSLKIGFIAESSVQVNNLSFQYKNVTFVTYVTIVQNNEKRPWFSSQIITFFLNVRLPLKVFKCE